MKKIILLTVFAGISFALYAQVSSLNENFNTSCVTSPGTIYTVMNWSTYTIPSGEAALSWSCAPLDGRDNTPGIECSNIYNSVYNIDTAWLFTPELDLSSYTGNIYLRFDTKYEETAAKLALRLYRDTPNGNVDTIGFTDLTQSVTATDSLIPHLASDPYIGDPDSSQWVTRQIDLTPYKTAHMYIAFLYTATANDAGTWILDNILTTETSLGVQTPDNRGLPLTILGNSTAGKVTFVYTIKEAGNYDLAIYDIMGRTVYREIMTVGAGTATHSVTGLSLSAGMYLIKMGNGNAYGIVKTVVAE